MGSLSVVGTQSSYRETMKSMARKGCDILGKAFEVIEKICNVISKIVGCLGLFFTIYYSSKIIDGLVAIGLPVFPAIALSAAVSFVFIEVFLNSKDLF